MERIHCSIKSVLRGAPEATAALDFVSDPAYGGVSLFVGRVRAHNVGRTVTGIDYDMYEPLALNLFRSLAREISTEFGHAVKLYVEHAHGRLKVGDTAVVVAAGSKHRDEAFRACRALIEAVKHRAPIWKQEHYIDGSSEWSEGCSLCQADHQHESSRAHVHSHQHADCSH